MPLDKPLRFPLQSHLAVFFVALALGVGCLVGWLGFHAARGILRDSSAELAAHVGKEAATAFAGLIDPAEMAVRLVSHDPLAQATTLERRLARLPALREALRDSPALTAIYAGYANGDFFLLRRLADESDRRFFAAPAAATWLVQSIERHGGRALGRFLFFDDRLRRLAARDDPAYAAAYDPRQRDWYQRARATTGQVETPPYVFHTTGRLGSTIANRAPAGGAVIGADVRLETLDHFLARQKGTPRTQLAVVTRDALTLASSEPSASGPRLPGQAPPPPRLVDLSPVFAALQPAFADLVGTSGATRQLESGDERWQATVVPLPLDGIPYPLYVITAIPERELLAAANALLQRSAIAIVAVIVLALPLAWLLARVLSRPLRRLAGEAEAIRRFDFASDVAIRSVVLEVDDLARTMAGMKRTISRFLDISQNAAAEKNFERLLPRLLADTLAASGCTAGILYLADETMLRPAVVLAADGTPLPQDNAPIALSALPDGLREALETGRAGCRPLVDLDDKPLLRAVQQACGATWVTGVPLRTRGGVLVGAMALFGRETIAGSRLAFIQALSGSLAVSLEARELIDAQKKLFDALVRLIAGAIDAKSPYTGGHCARVPELAKMLARAACAAEDGPYAGFRLDEEEWEALHIAAWLHDCGKVTTPEYVVDKATKLETLYDRIHEVRMRFEVLKRDAELACLKAIADGAEANAARARLAEELRQLDDDFAFIAECNEGGEFMAPARIERLKTIAARTWLRTLDDRLGIAHEEKARKERQPAPALPVAEPLLADRPEHILERQAHDRPPADPALGIRMDVPEHLYDRGELHNLGVARGTLTDEERYKINEHIVQTLVMLTQLPFPKHLRAVPEWAAGHHEKMDGSGYPRRLTLDQMPPVARMLAIADIFEALTAVDRPYKKGKTLSQALSIMARMRDEQHLDGELFELFLRAGVWREYGERFLRPEQIDAVDVEALVGKAVPSR